MTEVWRAKNWAELGIPSQPIIEWSETAGMYKTLWADHNLKRVNYYKRLIQAKREIRKQWMSKSHTNLMWERDGDEKSI